MRDLQELTEFLIGVVLIFFMIVSFVFTFKAGQLNVTRKDNRDRKRRGGDESDNKPADHSDERQHEGIKQVNEPD